MSRRFRFDPDLSLEALMQAWPQSVGVILEYRMLCVGCPISSFHTVIDACEAHGVDEGPFIADLEAAIVRNDREPAIPGAPRQSARGRGRW